jgi:predicted Fe-Mo cluster-binding NifX family protein
MKIAISTSGKSFDSSFDPRFGRAAAFCLIEEESENCTLHKNPGGVAWSGAGIQAAQFVVSLGSQVVISGAFGPKAVESLSPAGIEMYTAPEDTSLTVRQVLDLYKSGKLKKVNSSASKAGSGAAR